MLNTASLEYFFSPKNVAIIGASNDPLKAGRQITQNLLSMEFAGKVFPVNAKETEILGMPCYASIVDVPEPVEMVVLIIPAGAIYKTMAEIEARMEKFGDIKAIVCQAAGFAEVGDEEGRNRQKVLIETCRKYNIRVMGPNCVGLIDTGNRIDTTFVETLLPQEFKTKTGGISFVSQSGAVAVSLLMWGSSQPVPFAFNKFITVGNMADVDVLDMLSYLEEDKSTKVIGMYLEGYPAARELMDTLKRITRKKPVVVLKVGRTEMGASAAHSHTGSLAGADKIYDAAFRQCGVIRVNSLEELMDTMRAFDSLPLPKGENIFLLTQAGGPGIFCTDTLNSYPYLKFAKIKDEVKRELIDFLPPMAAVCKPEGYIDITASATKEHHAKSAGLLLNQPEVDGVILVTVVPMFLPPKELAEELANTCSQLKEKPFIPVIMAGNWVREARVILETCGIPTFETPDRAARVTANMVKYAKYLKAEEAN